jgi:hypothetical protein
MGASPPGSFRELLTDAMRFWEPRRILYNAVLAGVVLVWVVASWPHFRPAFTLQFLLLLVVLALIANACYCAAYLVDLLMQSSSAASSWKRRRWALWVAGTLVAILLANYWIVDEIYPFVR